MREGNLNMMNQKIEIKRANINMLDDILMLINAYRCFYKYANDNLDRLKAFIEARLINNESVIFLAYSEGKPIGFTQLYPSFTTLGLRKLWILNDLYIEKSYRGNGVGKILIDTVINFASNDGAFRVDIKTEHNNFPAKNLYDAYGFKRDDTYLYFQYLLPDNN